jgi:lysozyme
MTAYFADVSSNNATFDAPTYRHKGGHQLVAIKATEATGYVNPRYVEWVQAAHKARVTVAHYHFARPERGDGTAEFQHFWEIAGHHFQNGDYVVLDLETNAGDPRANVAFAHAFYAACTARRHQAVLYSSSSYLWSCGPALAPPGGRVWVAAYGPRPGALPKGMRQWAWQFTDGAVGPTPHQCQGIGRCDVSALNRRTAAALALRARLRRHA